MVEDYNGVYRVKFLEVDGYLTGSMDNSITMQQYIPIDYQRWKFAEYIDEAYYISNMGNGRILSINPCGCDGFPLSLQQLKYSAYQIWRIKSGKTKDGQNGLYLYNELLNMRIVVEDNRMNYGTQALANFPDDDKNVSIIVLKKD